MYERFTDRARKVMQLANQEANRFHHEYLGTEHILLGLVKEGSGVAGCVLKNMGIDLRKVRLEVEKIVTPGPDMVTMGKIPQTPRAKKVIEYAMEESRNINHFYVGTEHLLLGLLREQEGVASQVLMNLGLCLEDVREETLNILGFVTQDPRGPAMEQIPPEQAKQQITGDTLESLLVGLPLAERLDMLMRVVVTTKLELQTLRLATAPAEVWQKNPDVEAELRHLTMLVQTVVDRMGLEIPT